jgi:hypothetical protein
LTEEMWTRCSGGHGRCSGNNSGSASAELPLGSHDPKAQRELADRLPDTEPESTDVETVMCGC